MNGSCAGGTGAFIDQMATLLHLTPSEMNEGGKNGAEDLYHRQPLRRVRQKRRAAAFEPGASKNDVALSIFGAVVNRPSPALHRAAHPRQGVVLGGPLTFLSELRRSLTKPSAHGCLPGKQPVLCGAGRRAVCTGAR